MSLHREQATRNAGADEATCSTAIVDSPIIIPITSKEALDWANAAPELAAWTAEKLVNRVDVYGRYKSLGKRKNPKDNALTARDLTLEVIERHYRGQDHGDIIGLHSTAANEGESPEFSCRSGALDIDRHSEEDDPVANGRAALAWYDVLVTLGFRPLLTDSNGWGGYQLRAIFDAPTPADEVHRFMKWLCSDHLLRGLETEPETYPKQPHLGKGKGCGNWLRLPGRHHTREHYSRVWNGRVWLKGVDAIGFILSLPGDSASKIPASDQIWDGKDWVKSPWEPMKASGDGQEVGKGKATGLRSDDDLAREALTYIGHLGGGQAYAHWLKVGMCLRKLDGIGLRLWDEWSRGDPVKYQAGACQEKWATFTTGSQGDVNLGTLFKMAQAEGWPWPPKSGAKQAEEAPRNGRHEANGKAPEPPDPSTDEPPVYATLADALTLIGDTRWVWERWIPAGCMSILAAVAGCGKTRTAMDLARRLWLGLPMPDGSPNPFPAETPTLWIMYDRNWAESGDVAKNFGVPAEAILLASLKHAPLDNPDFDDPRTMEALQLQVEAQKPGLIVIDTITYATRRNTSKANEAKAAFDGIMQLAAVTGVAVLAMTHLNKEGEVLGRRITERARSVLLLSTPDPEGQPERRKFWVEKTAVKKPDPLGGTFTDTSNDYDNLPPTPPEEPTKHRGPKPAKSTELAKWLFEKLSEGPKRVKALVDLARFDRKMKAEGSISPLYDAKDRVDKLPECAGMKVHEDKDGNKTTWSLKKIDCDPDPNELHPDHPF
jgi:AAA domain/Primase C terminal 2 (PriCT-2)